MRKKSGIPGLDELTDGGFPERTINLISGPAGSAKSLFGMQYIFNGAKLYEEKGIFLALEESRDNILRASKSYGMGLEEFERQGKIRLIDFGEMRRDTDKDEDLALGIVSFRNLQEFILRLIDETGATRLVIDSVSAVGLYYGNVDELRRELFRFCRTLKEKNVTTVIITEAVDDKQTRFGIEQFVADSSIVLGYENVEGEYRRTVTIYKMRFTRHDPYKHPFLITNRGIEVDFEETIY